MRAEGRPGWLDDRAAQRRTRAAIDALAMRWNEGPVHRRIAGTMAALPERSGAAAADAARTLFSDHQWVDALLGQLADAMRKDPFLEPPFRPINSDIHSGLIVYEDEHLSIAAGVTNVARLAARKAARRGRTSIAFSGQVDVLKFVRAGGARLGFWEAPFIREDFTAATAGRCRRTGSRAIGDGEVLVVDGRFQSFIIERARSNLVVLQATVKHDCAPLAVEYDSETREYVGCSAADDSASRIQMIATLLRRLGSAEAFPAIAGFLDHRDFFVRWHVMRELLGLDAGAALPHLKRMAARDPHPETRRAARLVLDRIDARGFAPERKAA